MTIFIDGKALTLEDIKKVAKEKYKVKLNDTAIEKIKKSSDIVDKIVKDKKIIYGITTGFGKFANKYIDTEEVVQLQVNLLRSHATGTGDIFNEEITRAIMLLRINTLTKGFSGIKPATLDLLIDMLNNNILPIIYTQGSVGASGDLAPLSHMALPLIGEGEIIYKGKRMSGAKVFDILERPLHKLSAKEGLALINGTQVMTAVASLALAKAFELIQTASISASLTTQALLGNQDFLNPLIHECRPLRGQNKIAEFVRNILNGSSYEPREKVQDAYSIRCIPQVLGASLDSFYYINSVIKTEINSVTDNPLIFSENEIYSGGNFHGQPIALCMDFLSIAAAEIANISERRINRLLNFHLNDLPPFLTEKGGLNSGFMIWQYTAAALVSENKSLAHPASVDSIPTSADQEDHVSMGTIGSRKAIQIVKNVEKVIAIELMCAAQALDFRNKKYFSKGVKAVHKFIRKHVEHLFTDRNMQEDYNKILNMVITGKLSEVLNKDAEINFEF